MNSRRTAVVFLIAGSALALSAPAIASGAATNPDGAETSSATMVRKAKTTFPGNGTFQVGRDIKPGTYVSSSTGTFGGYWERLKCATGNFSCIIANENTDGQSFVTILKTDKFFSTTRMGTWRLASKVKPTRPATVFSGEGMFRVGIDIRPGTYVSSPSGDISGYWERMSCATGDFDCIISNDNVDGRTIVKISKNDKYFKTVRMNKWKRR